MPRLLACLLVILSVSIVVVAAAPSRAAAEPAQPRRLALLIGVSDYAILPADPAPGEPGDLSSAPHDVARMIGALTQLGLARGDVTILADHLDPQEAAWRSDGAPKRAAIVAALAQLARRAASGDQVLIYYTGHGAQQPDRDDSFGPADERDGQDELILPADISFWGEEGNAVPGAITDDELGRAAEAIRAKGAFVWLIVDACHSGTALRDGVVATPKGVELKNVSPAALHIPPAAIARARDAAARKAATTTFDRGPLDVEPGQRAGVVAFYAAGPDQVALAVPFEEAQNRSVGMLTFALTKGLANGHASSYRDLALMVEAIYAVPKYNIGGGRQPGFDGDLDRAIMGFAAVPPKQWTVRAVDGALTLAGGQLDGVAEGDILAIRYGQMAKPTAYVRVEKAGVSTATLQPIDYEGVSAAAAGQIVTNRTFLFVATQVAAGVPLALRVGKPRAGDGPAGADLAEALAMIAADPARLPGARVEFVETGQNADLYLAVGNDRLWFTDMPDGFDRTGRHQPPWMPLAPGASVETLANDLAARLRAFARSAALRRALLAIGPGETRGALSTEYLIDPASGGETNGCGPKPAAPFTPPPTALTLAAWKNRNGGLARLHHCDVVYTRVTNHGAVAIDITPLYFSRDGSIAYLGLGTGLSEDDVRITPGATKTFFFRALTVAGGALLPTGQELLAIIAVAQRPGQNAVTSYRYLTQSAPPAQRRDGSGTRLGALLDTAGFGIDARRGTVSAGAEDAAVTMSSWLVGTP